MTAPPQGPQWLPLAQRLRAVGASYVMVRLPPVRELAGYPRAANDPQGPPPEPGPVRA